ncbi:putative acetolactate synthase small subunit [Candidatus Sulcia muelleri SMDSEM]|uniref:Putative acetolactate synthase small subunit n=1 Tax=Karelsulcia muelleri (strain SMDSEM) TaxID=595499 RepID=C7LKL1_KARMS|nr:putative acetolactate synthase small subunit [Candidatus Karelsulcia muelleri SMDSEM]
MILSSNKFMKKKLHIIIISDNIIVLLIRIILIFNRRNLKIQNFSFLEKKLNNNYYYIIKIEIFFQFLKIENVIKQIKKIIGINKLFIYNLKINK